MCQWMWALRQGLGTVQDLELRRASEQPKVPQSLRAQAFRSAQMQPWPLDRTPGWGLATVRELGRPRTLAPHGIRATKTEMLSKTGKALESTSQNAERSAFTCEILFPPCQCVKIALGRDSILGPACIWSASDGQV